MLEKEKFKSYVIEGVYFTKRFIESILTISEPTRCIGKRWIEEGKEGHYEVGVCVGYRAMTFSGTRFTSETKEEATRFFKELIKVKDKVGD